MFEAIPLHLLLAMTCVAEISFVENPTECIIMWEINERSAKAANRSLRKQTLLYNSYWKSTKQRNKRKWIQFLTYKDKPEHWPERLRWGVHKRLWLRYVKASREFLASRHKRVALCPHAFQYGGPSEYPRSYMKRIQCLPGALQWYWEKPNIENPPKGIISKKLMMEENAISESILTQKRREARRHGATE